MKNIKIIIVISILLSVFLTGFFIHKYDKYHEKNDVNNIKNIEYDYECQNISFTGYWIKAYLPYNLLDKKSLKINLDVYKQKTGKIVTEDDVKNFLQDDLLANGTPKTYKNGGDKKIYDYVVWGFSQPTTIREIV